ncbi:S-adenosyl-L-methionine-dependent methyltransferases superfamily protein [Actinidia rufa]|uniref:S-adenosyl-L-methionine-dependent methyltransferases superfamily protein n=1 Tax=Actinidia rufa TaxID=165716 RepID=A0A7J0FV49_9ERIC|nr:S-adenosyl-L-methionine-dependent methyltransferases superfamily protein [Actinidia rufa]
MSHGGHHFGDPTWRISPQRELVVFEEDLELIRDVGLREIHAFEAEKLLLHLGELFLRGINLSEDERDLLGDERDVLVKLRGWIG